MTQSQSIWRFAMAAALGLALAACSTGPQAGLRSADVAASPADIEAIAQLLDKGEVRGAQKRLDAALKRDPLNPSLLVLQQGIGGDAVADLGPNHYPYMAAPGDTMPALAERFLGTRLKSYQLARYNGFDNPAALKAGQMLRIPGQPQRAGNQNRAQPSNRSKPASQPNVALTPTRPTPPPAAAAARPVDRAGAQRARTAGLAALNKGDVGQAVSLLQRAANLDPGNATIAGDLARARRISATVRSQQ